MTRKAVVIDRPDQIAKFRLALIIQYARSRGRGIHLTRQSVAPTLARLRSEYGVVAGSWEKMARELEKVKAEWERDGVPDKFLHR